MKTLCRLALRIVVRMDMDKLSPAELDEWAPALQDAAERLESRREEG